VGTFVDSIAKKSTQRISPPRSNLGEFQAGGRLLAGLPREILPATTMSSSLTWEQNRDQALRACFAISLDTDGMGVFSGKIMSVFTSSPYFTLCPRKPGSPLSPCILYLYDVISPAIAEGR
jgi:hypothetical protein